MFAVVDLETTGGNPGTDKIIEIAIFIHDGTTIRKEYSSLVNPGVPIPTFISRLTRITDDMVSAAPRFSDIAGEVATLLGEHIFVAHNVMFDYSFLAYALAQEGIHYENKMLCTCKTSRLLLPGHPSYSLSKLCRSLSIDLNDAHRAAADARATVKVLDMLITRAGGVLDPYYHHREKPVNKSKLPDAELEKLPGKTGILFFYDEKGTVVYLTKAGNVRKKAWHIVNRMHTRRYADVAASAVSVDYQATGSELLAGILEVELVGSLQPRYNRKYKTAETRYGIYTRLNDSGYLAFETGLYEPARKPVITVASSREAHAKLNAILLEYQLRPAAEIDHPDRQLFREPAEVYNERANRAYESLSNQAANFIITGRGPKADCLSHVVVKDGRYAGYCFTDGTVAMTQPAEIHESLQPGTDHPAIFKAIIGCVSRGRYLKIINF